MLKIKGTEIQQALTELMLEAAGPLAQAIAPVDDGDARRRLHRRARAALLQHAQDDDLRGLQRDPAQHHRQACARALTHHEFRPHRRAATSRRLDRALRRARLHVRDAPQHRRVAATDSVATSGGRWPSWACSACRFRAAYGGFGGGAMDAMSLMEAIGDALIVEPWLADRRARRAARRAWRQRRAAAAHAARGREGRMQARVRARRARRAPHARACRHARARRRAGYAISRRQAAPWRTPPPPTRWSCRHARVAATADPDGISLLLVDRATRRA